jgi:hypothetical protein
MRPPAYWCLSACPGFASAVLAQSYPPGRSGRSFPSRRGCGRRPVAPHRSEDGRANGAAAGRREPRRASGQIGMEISRALRLTATRSRRPGWYPVVAPHTYKKIPYDPLRSLVAVAIIATNYPAVANPGPRSRPRPQMTPRQGQPASLPSPPTANEVFPLRVRAAARDGGFHLYARPVQGVAQAITDVLGGQVQLGVGLLHPVPHVSAGRHAQLIAVTNPARRNELPIFAEVFPDMIRARPAMRGSRRRARDRRQAE